MLLFSVLTCLSLHSSWRPRGCSQLAGWPALTFPSASHREQLVPSCETLETRTYHYEYEGSSCQEHLQDPFQCGYAFPPAKALLCNIPTGSPSRHPYPLSRARSHSSDCEQVDPSGCCVQPSARSVRLGWRIRCSWVVLVDGHHDRAMLHCNNTKPIEIDGLPPRQTIRDQPTPFCHVRLRVG